MHNNEPEKSSASITIMIKFLQLHIQTARNSIDAKYAI